MRLCTVVYTKYILAGTLHAPSELLDVDSSDVGASATRCLWKVEGVIPPICRTFMSFCSIFNHGIQTRRRLAGIDLTIHALLKQIPELLSHFLTGRSASLLAIVRLDNQ
jgi:hypothetical protein